MKILLKNGTVIDPSSGIGGIQDVLIENGLIKGLDLNINSDNSEIIDCTGKVVCPGFIDLHVHLREPGDEHKETVVTGTKAAVAGGFTTICCMPNTKPPLDSYASMHFIRGMADKFGSCDVKPIGAVSVGMNNEQLTEMVTMKNAGAIAFSDDAFPIQSNGFMRRVFEYSLACDAPIALHCEDQTLTEDGSMHEGKVSMSLGLRGMPEAAETLHVMRALELAKLTKAHVHILHVSCAESASLILRAKEDGVRVTSEVCPHHLISTETDVGEYDTNAKMSPPLRTVKDVTGLREALLDGVLDCIATDHAPHSIEEKEVEFDSAPFGIVGLETAFGILMTELVHTGVMSLSQLIERLTTKPAQCFNMDKGTLHKNSIADITIVDPNSNWTVNSKLFESKGKNTLYEGKNLRGRVIKCISEGQIVYSAER